MTPKEKAKDLIARFIKTERMCDCFCEHGINDCNCTHEQTELESAKKCALICVDEIMKSDDLIIYNKLNKYLNVLEHTSDDAWIAEEKIAFWNKVEQEINKL